MTAKQLYDTLKQQHIPDDLEIATVSDAFNLHDKIFIPFRVKLFENGINGFMPHYRGEQKFGWDILPGIFRPPLTHLSSQEGRALEEQAILEFERTVETKIGGNVLRKLFNHEKYGKQWGLIISSSTCRSENNTN